MKHVVLDRGSYSTNLPQEYYLSQDIFQTELTKVFSRQWLVVGHVSSVRKPGDYYVKQVGPESLIVARDQDGALRVYFNVCRHRGFRMLDDGAKGCARGFVCPYHHWSYDLDGRLRTVPGSRDGQDFSYRDWPLQEARVETWHGFIFVYLSEEAPKQSLADVMRDVTDEDALAKIEPERMKLAHQETYVINANWKTVLENNSECYHCGAAHPSLSATCNYQAFYADKRDGSHFPLHPGMSTFSLDGARVSAKPLGTPQPDAFSTGFLVMPNFGGPVFFADHAVSLEVTPLDVSRTQLICEWYVHEDAVEGVDYETEPLKAVFHVTNLEDGALAERNFEGVKSMRFKPGPVHPRREDGVQAAHAIYMQMMQAE